MVLLHQLIPPRAVSTILPRLRVGIPVIGVVRFIQQIVQGYAEIIRDFPQLGCLRRPAEVFPCGHRSLANPDFHRNRRRAFSY